MSEDLDNSDKESLEATESSAAADGDSPAAEGNTSAAETDSPAVETGSPAAESGAKAEDPDKFSAANFERATKLAEEGRQEEALAAFASESASASGKDSTSPSQSATSADPSETDAMDPLVLGFVIVLWIAAAVFVYSALSNASLDWHLGNITQSMATRGQIDQPDIDAIVAMGPSVIPALVKELSKPKNGPKLKVGIIAVIANFAGPEAQKALRAAQKHENPQVRINAIFQLLNLNKDPKEQLAIFNEARATETDRFARATLYLQVLPKLGDKATIFDALRKGLFDPDLEVRAAAHATLSGISGCQVPYDLKASEELRKAQDLKLADWITKGAKPEAVPPFPGLKKLGKTPDKDATQKSPSTEPVGK